MPHGVIIGRSISEALLICSVLENGYIKKYCLIRKTYPIGGNRHDPELYCKRDKFLYSLSPKFQISRIKFQEGPQSRPCLPSASMVLEILVFEFWSF